ncbi:MAG: sigma-70 family RNA polymerase sigma factor [Aureliella sp.]
MGQPSPHNNDTEFVAELTKCQTALVLYVRCLLAGSRAAEEVVQQSNSKIWQKRSDFQLGTNFRAWAFAVARFEVLNFCKQQARDARLQFSDELEQVIAVEAVAVEVGDDLIERQQALKLCLSELKAESRDLLMSRYGSTESLVEFAARVGRSAGGVRVTLSRLRTTLNQCIERRIASEQLGSSEMRPDGGAS